MKKKKSKKEEIVNLIRTKRACNDLTMDLLSFEKAIIHSDM